MFGYILVGVGLLFGGVLWYRRRQKSKLKPAVMLDLEEFDELKIDFEEDEIQRQVNEKFNWKATFKEVF